MNRSNDNLQRHEGIIAALLWYGTWVASAIVAAGMGLGALQETGSLHFGPSGYAIVRAGVALFILLPVMRVALMLILFLYERDYAYVAISALVLAIIAAGVLIGL